MNLSNDPLNNNIPTTEFTENSYIPESRSNSSPSARTSNKPPRGQITLGLPESPIYSNSNLATHQESLAAQMLKYASALRKDVEIVSQVLSQNEKLLAEKEEDNANLRQALLKLEGRLEKSSYTIESDASCKCTHNCSIL